MNDYDLAIVGGGLVGASLAVALHGSGLRVALIEAAAPPLAEAAWDERCIGLNEATRRIFDSLGVWGAMCGDAEAIAATHVSEQGRFGVARFHASEAGLDALGYNTPLRAIHGSLLQRVRDSGAATLLCPARVDDVQVDGEYVHLHGAALDGGLRARLLVAADGARSPIRQRFGIATEAHDYAQTAIVSSVRTQREHAGIAHERFTPDGPIAVLPRPGRVCTVVWTVPTDVAERLLALSEAAFLQALQAAFGHRLGQFSALGRRGPGAAAQWFRRRAGGPRCDASARAGRRGRRAGLRHRTGFAPVSRHARCLARRPGLRLSRYAGVECRSSAIAAL